MKKKNKIKYILLLLVSIISISSISYAANSVSSNEYKITSQDNTNYIIGIYQNTRVEKVKANIKTDNNITIYNEKGEALGEEAIVVTGSKIQIGNETYIAIVCGDVNGDGNVNLTDLVKVKSHLIGKEILEKEKGIAADVDANGRVTSTDILNLKRLLVRIIEEREIFEKKYRNNEYEYKKNTLTNKIGITELIDTKASGTLQIPSKIDGNEVKEIENFLGENSKITKVTIPTGIEKINSIAFSGLKNLQEIEVSGLNQNYSSKEGILYNKAKDTIVSYPRGKEGTEYTIGEEVKKIGEYAYYKNSKIEKLYLRDEIEEVGKNAFEEMKGKVYVKEGSELIAMLREKGINYAIDAKPEISKLTSIEGTNQVITLNIEATDDVGIVAWSIELKGIENIEWNEINQTKKLTTTYQQIRQNGTYVVRIKDNVGNIGEKEIIINGIDTSIPKMTSIKIISPTSGEYKVGQKIIIRVQFSEKIKGTAPTLKLRIGDSSVTATATNPTGTLDYIDYSYTTTEKQTGNVEIESYIGGNITDIMGNKASIVKLANTGNTITIKGNYDAKYGPYKYAISGTVIQTYKDESIEVSIEKIDRMYVSKIWIAEPSKQIKKAEGDALIGNMLAPIPNVIIGTNGSYDNAGKVVITNGVITRTSNDESHFILGINKSGRLMQKELYKSWMRPISGSEMLEMGIVNTFASWPGAIIENNKYDSGLAEQNKDHRARTAVGQVNENNYILINASDSAGVSIPSVGEMAQRLNCSFLYMLDGGRSTALWFRQSYIIPSSGNRKRPDVLYFTTLE